MDVQRPKRLAPVGPLWVILGRMAYDFGRAVIPDIAEGFAAAAKTSGQGHERTPPICACGGKPTAGLWIRKQKL